MKAVKVEMPSAEELAYIITDLGYEGINANEKMVNNRLLEDFGCDLQGFKKNCRKINACNKSN